MTADADRVGRFIGESVAAPDGLAKASGRQEFGADLAAEDMLWAEIARSPHPHATITRIDPAPALSMPGVHAVITHLDLAGMAGGRNPEFGVERADEPVLAGDVVRYLGEPVAAVAAERPDLARAAVAAIEVEYETLPNLEDPEEAIHAAEIHPDGNVVQHVVVRRGDAEVEGEVVVEGSYDIAAEVPHAIDPVAGIALPVAEGGVELRWPSLNVERDRAAIARCLGLEPAQVRYVCVPAGGERGPRHDVGIQAALGVLALHAWRPVKIVLSDEESALLRPRPHPARMWYRHHADLDGALIRVEARLVFDGGAYATTSGGMLAVACTAAAGPYRVPHARIEALAVRTNRPPAGGSRGDGALQVCFAHEAQMDKLALVLGLDPIELRRRNAVKPGDRLVTGQLVAAPAPLAELIDACAAEPLPARHRADSLVDLPGGPGRTSERAAVRRGVGIAVGMSAVLAADGAPSELTVTVQQDGVAARVTCGHPDTGQGFGAAVHQVVRDLLGVRRVTIGPPETPPTDRISSGPNWQAGRGLLALEAIAEACREIAAKRASENGPLEATVTVAAPPTTPLDIDGQGEPCAGLAFAAYRAVVDVDDELGLARVVDMTIAQHAGRVLNPLQVRSRLEAGIGLGVALALDGGEPATADDGRSLRVAALLEDSGAETDLRAATVTDPPIVVTPAAVAAAIRDAAGVAIVQLPARPDHIAAAPRA